MSLPDILLLGAMPAIVGEGLTAQGFGVHPALKQDELDALIDRIGPTVGGLVRAGGFFIGEGLLSRLPHCEIVANFGVGYEAVDVAAAARRDVIVTNTPDVLNEEVADTALALLLMTVRELTSAERYLRAGRWPKEGAYRLAPSLRERRIGIFGLGRIGIAIARRLEAIGVTVAYHNRKPRNDVAYRYYPSLQELATAVDTLVITAPGGKGTDKIVDGPILAALGPEGILINIGRGTIVDEDALLDALEAGHLRAGLDVYPNEPNVNPRFIGLDNVVLLPHLGSASLMARKAMAELVVANLKGWFRDGMPVTPVPETPVPAKSAWR